ncbi:helix-turn-helix transcriptional regulator [Chloroflexota bacterium]
MFENRIRERRQELGLSQTKLACLIGMAEPTLSNLELGKWKPWPKVKRDLARTLGLSEKALFPNNLDK